MNWKHLLDFDKFDLVRWDDPCQAIVDAIYWQLNDTLDRVQKDVERYCESQEYFWYMNHRNDYDYISNCIKTYVSKINLKGYLNFDHPDINIDYEGIQIALLRAGEKHVADYFVEEDTLRYKEALVLHSLRII